ncbi:mechanosensitive ion channel [Reichenbachiella carrageenanivorans]|uniref:Mechanosensitive ion channel n=1 Tax=Reichenbachiella carrageenanivorans TaxID=2979869 RepID=A0ABY6D0C3_9BACT|nr:mechanosensitive ion channel [Reichenbachiella carrageenanivorans]UXX78513.1 mechanosensitive ion channel [Reichenbachiella carrageenanivorans]
MVFPDYLQTLINSIHDTLPGVLGALVVFVVGWLIALLIKRVVHSLMKKTDWDERLLGNTIVDTNKFLANFAYYIFMVVILLIVLEMLGFSYVLDPIRNMLDEFLSFVPKIVAAGAVVFIGYILAKFVSNLVKMAGSFLDRIGEQIGFKETEKLVYFLQQIVFIAIFIPAIIQGLNALELDAITTPANNILHKLMDAVPHIIGAGLIMAIFFIGGKFVATFVNDLLVNVGVDKLSKQLHLFIVSDDQSLSKVLSNVLHFFIVFFGVISGVELLGMDRLTEVMHNILNLSGDILFGLVVMVLGNFVASVVYGSMSKKKENEFAAGVARVAIIGLFLAIALRTMGIANSIIDLAFGLTLGSLAVTVALAYGLGGREAAGKHMEQILKKFRKE